MPCTKKSCVSWSSFTKTVLFWLAAQPRSSAWDVPDWVINLTKGTDKRRCWRTVWAGGNSNGRRMTSCFIYFSFKTSWKQVLTHGLHRNEGLGVTLSPPSPTNSPLLLPLHRHLLCCPSNRVPQLTLPFVLEAHKKPVVCVIRFIYYGSAPGGVL